MESEYTLSSQELEIVENAKPACIIDALANVLCVTAIHVIFLLIRTDVWNKIDYSKFYSIYVPVWVVLTLAQPFYDYLLILKDLKEKIGIDTYTLAAKDYTGLKISMKKNLFQRMKVPKKYNNLIPDKRQIKIKYSKYSKTILSLRTTD